MKNIFLNSLKYLSCTAIALAIAVYLIWTKPMFMGTPRDADGLDKIGLHLKDCPQKMLVTEKWLMNRFRISDATIAEHILRSISSTSDPCPCPYLLNGNRRCGGNSSYSQDGGKSYFCYPADVLQFRKQIENAITPSPYEP